MTKFTAQNATVLRSTARNLGRVARKVVFVVTCEADDGSWFELDAIDANHAQALALDQVQKMNCRGCTCWHVNREGKIARKPFAHKFAESILSENSITTSERNATLHGPAYPDLGLSKYRRIKNPTPLQKQEHGAAVHAKIRELQRQEIQRATLPPKPRCASGTFLNCGEDIHNFLRAKARANLLAYPAKVRKARTDDEWRVLYHLAMIEKRRNLAANQLLTMAPMGA